MRRFPHPDAQTRRSAQVDRSKICDLGLTRVHTRPYSGGEIPRHEIITRRSDTKITRGRRSINGTIALRVPLDVITAKCAPYLRRGKPEARTAMCNLDDDDIVKAYAAEYRGIIQYYLLATDVWRLARLRWVAETSMLKTLAAKHKSTVTATATKYKAVVETPHGKRTCFQARVDRDGKQPLVARFGGIPLVRQKTPRSSTASPTGQSPTPSRN